MDVLHPNCCGLDVHKKTVVACRITHDDHGSRHTETRTFSTMTQDLLALSDWLCEDGVTHVAMESTGEYWRPVYNLLEATFELLLVNARHIKMVPGRKTDVKDAEWIAELLEHGLLRASFVPPAPQRDLRELTRHRTSFVRQRCIFNNRIQKVLETCNIKLASVASDVLGVSGRAMLDAIVQGQNDPKALAELAQGRMQSKREELQAALLGRVREHHRFLLKELLDQIDAVDETIRHFDERIEALRRPFEEAVLLLDTIPGVATRAAENILSEIGTDMSRFPSARHLCAWAGVAPGNNESAGKRLSGRVRDGNAALRVALVQAAHAAVHTKDSYLSALYHRLSARRGSKRAIMAVAHAMLVTIYFMLLRKEPYHELGGNYFDTLRPEKTARRLTHRLEELGFRVTLTPATSTA